MFHLALHFVNLNFILLKSYLVNGSINVTLHKHLFVQVLPKIMEDGIIMSKMLKPVFIRMEVVLHSLC